MIKRGDVRVIRKGEEWMRDGGFGDKIEFIGYKIEVMRVYHDENYFFGRMIEGPQEGEKYYLYINSLGPDCPMAQ